jgi:hypothetical protein
MNFGIIIVLALGALWALGIFLGVIGGFSKNFAHTAPTLDSSDVKSQQEDTIEQTKEKQKQLMDDLRQKMQDARH